MLFLPAFSPAFYIVYVAGGITDMVDGTVARRTDTESEFGSKLDTVADIFFAASALVKIVPELSLPTWLWLWVCAIVAIKVVSMAYGFAKNRALVSDHSTLNKVTGLLVFLLPLTIPFLDILYTSTIVCAVATAAAATESYRVLTGDSRISAV
jgi:CDP-diacylglycerol--glycerol-3-phosphate 3-phosphatidyltransferase